MNERRQPLASNTQTHPFQPRPRSLSLGNILHHSQVCSLCARINPRNVAQVQRWLPMLGPSKCKQAEAAVGSSHMPFFYPRFESSRKDEDESILPLAAHPESKPKPAENSNIITRAFLQRRVAARSCRSAPSTSISNMVWRSSRTLHTGIVRADLPFRNRFISLR